MNHGSDMGGFYMLDKSDEKNREKETQTFYSINLR